MKRTQKIIGLLLVLVLCMSFALAGCQDGPATNAPGSTAGTKPADKPTTPGTTTKPADQGEELKIAVVPETMEIYAGDAFELLMGVTVNKADAKLFVSDDEGFDRETPGTYTITYTAKLGDEQTTATRTITVLQAKSDLTLEVVKNHMTAGKWEGVLMNFKNAQYMELNADYTTTEALTGVFKNTSDKDILVTIGGKNGEAAIIDANGMVIEGRDGANGRLVNAENPVRTSAPTGATIIVNGEEVVMAENFAKAMTIPAGGYVIVVQNGAFGSGFDFDGRGFICQCVVHQYGNVIRLYWTDTKEELTNYINQKPVVSGNGKVLAVLGDTSFNLEEAILAGLAASDDNGTFSAEDDVKIDSFAIVNNGGFDINVAGEYTITLSVTDGELTTEFTRVVEVKADGVGILTVGQNKYYVSMDRVAINQELTKPGNLAFVIYTKEFSGELLTNGWGIAFILDENGVLVRIYDGANAKYYDAENASGVQDSSKVTSAGYLAEAFASLQDGETLLAAINNGDNAHRAFLGSAESKVIGNKVSGLDMQFNVTDVTITINGAELTVPEGKWLYNTYVNEIVAGNPENAYMYSMLIFDKSYAGEPFNTNGYGCAIVLDQYGVLVRIYDGANGGFWTAEGKAESMHFTNATFATVAFAELQEGELLIVFPNDGGSNTGRNWALDLRGLKGTNYFGEVATLTGFEFEEVPVTEKVLTINGAELIVPEGKWLYNTYVNEIVAGNPENAYMYTMLIFDKNYTGEPFNTNGYGCAIVLNQYGELVRIYDGANGGFWTAEGKAGTTHFTTATFATVAWSELQEGELLIIFPNDGGSNAGRNWALDLRGLKGTTYWGEVATLTGFTFEKKEN